MSHLFFFFFFRPFFLTISSSAPGHTLTVMEMGQWKAQRRSFVKKAIGTAVAAVVALLVVLHLAGEIWIAPPFWMMGIFLAVVSAAKKLGPKCSTQRCQRTPAPPKESHSNVSQFKNQLLSLSELGFSDMAANITALRANNGDINRTIQALLEQH